MAKYSISEAELKNLLGSYIGIESCDEGRYRFDSGHFDEIERGRIVLTETGSSLHMPYDGDRTWVEKIFLDGEIIYDRSTQANSQRFLLD